MASAIGAKQNAALKTQYAALQSILSHITNNLSGKKIS
jgi:hypothetical protein